MDIGKLALYAGIGYVAYKLYQSYAATAATVTPASSVPATGATPGAPAVPTVTAYPGGSPGGPRVGVVPSGPPAAAPPAASAPAVAQSVTAAQIVAAIKAAGYDPSAAMTADQISYFYQQIPGKSQISADTYQAMMASIGATGSTVIPISLFVSALNSVGLSGLGALPARRPYMPLTVGAAAAIAFARARRAAAVRTGSKNYVRPGTPMRH